MNILVTGGAGFIGSHLVDRLLALNNQVTAVDNLITGSQQNLKPHPPNLRFIKADVTKADSWLKDKFEAIFHLASPASPKGYLDNPILTYQVNSYATEQLFNKAIKDQAKFVFASTSEVYGDPPPKHHPQPESYWGNVNPIGIRACYDESKRFGEMVITTLARQFNYLNWTILRIFNTYGPRMAVDDQRVMPNLITQALKNKPLTVYRPGAQTRSFCYVTDLVEYIIRAATWPAAKAQIINIGNDQEITMHQLAKIIIQLTKSHSSISYKKKPEDDPQQRRPDLTKALKLLKYKPKVDLKTGLSKTIAYFQKTI